MKVNYKKEANLKYASIGFVLATGVILFSAGLIIQLVLGVIMILGWDFEILLFIPVLAIIMGYLLIKASGVQLRKLVDIILNIMAQFI